MVSSKDYEARVRVVQLEGYDWVECRGWAKGRREERVERLEKEKEKWGSEFRLLPNHFYSFLWPHILITAIFYSYFF